MTEKPRVRTEFLGAVAADHYALVVDGATKPMLARLYCAESLTDSISSGAEVTSSPGRTASVASLLPDAAMMDQLLWRITMRSAVIPRRVVDEAVQFGRYADSKGRLVPLPQLLRIDPNHLFLLLEHESLFSVPPSEWPSLQA